MNTIAISFLKEKKVDYYIERNIVNFTCFACGDKITLEPVGGSWCCTGCVKTGEFLDLVDLHGNLEEESKLSLRRIYNPKREFQQIKNILTRQYEKYGDKSLDKAIARLDKLSKFILDKYD